MPVRLLSQPTESVYPSRCKYSESIVLPSSSSSTNLRVWNGEQVNAGKFAWQIALKTLRSGWPNSSLHDLRLTVGNASVCAKRDDRACAAREQGCGFINLVDSRVRG